MNAFLFEKAGINMFSVRNTKHFNNVLPNWIEIKSQNDQVVHPSWSLQDVGEFSVITAQNSWARTWRTSMNIMSFSCFLTSVHRNFLMSPYSQIRVYTLTLAAITNMSLNVPYFLCYSFFDWNLTEIISYVSPSKEANHHFLNWNDATPVSNRDRLNCRRISHKS